MINKLVSLLSTLIVFLICTGSVFAQPFAYVTNASSNDVSVIDTSTNTVVVPSIPVGTAPEGIAITPDGTHAYVANFVTNDVSVIDTSTNTVVVPSIPVGSTPQSIAITSDGTHAYVTNVGSNDVSVIDTSTNTVVVPSIPVGSSPLSIAITPSPPPSQFINLSPNTATNYLLTDHTVTAAINIDGIPEPGVFVTFEVISGPNAGLVSIPDNGECSPNDDCRTDADGEVSWTYTGGNRFPGTDMIVASFFSEISEMVEESNTVEKIWVRPPINTPTLSEWGLITMAAILGIVGFMVMRKRKMTA